MIEAWYLEPTGLELPLSSAPARINRAALPVILQATVNARIGGAEPSWLSSKRGPSGWAGDRSCGMRDGQRCRQKSHDARYLRSRWVRAQGRSTPDQRNRAAATTWACPRAHKSPNSATKYA
ncbi:predicted protein [Coccidioides posadasii str. Silveira]|uniref:Predicted protein n=1 Tax=Coccidioides posadasii (strain RMSCC 757 / Silveira) TaxID=443226 RepID=E9CZI8_COCPS|nr:predicted protein [Coccidioides posadasii str. Silveira]